MIHRLLRAVLAPLAYCVLASTTLQVVVRRVLPLVALAVLALGISATNAAAGVFTVATCQADPLNYSSRAFTHVVTRNMRIRRACNPIGPGIRGVTTSNVPHDGRIKRGAIALVTINAPPGTQMQTLRWAGTLRRKDCRFALQMWADAPGGIVIPIKNVRANRRCPRAGVAQAAGIPLHKYDIPGTTRIVQRVVCVGSSKQKWCSGRGLNFIRTYQASIDIVDDIAPTVEIIQDTPLATGAWVGGTQPLNYTASDNAGVRFARAWIGGQSRSLHSRDCVLASPTGPFAAPLPCPSGLGQIEVKTLELTEGTQPLSVEAVDPAGNPTTSAALTARIDNTPPARVDIGVEGGQEWRNRNDWVMVWTNPLEADRAPIAAAQYELCGTGGANCSRGSQAGPDVSRMPIAVPGAGEWTLSIWRFDAAGNGEEDNASVPVTLRYDPEPPNLTFEPGEAADPTRVAVNVTDQVSGLADGAIEIAAQGSGAWQSLGTHKEGSRLVTRIDDVLLPAGTYSLRARARDLAGNEASTDTRADGQPMVVTLPLRTPSTMQAGFVRAVRRPGKRHKDLIVLRPTRRVAFGKRVTIAGRLATSAGRGIVGAPVQVLSTTGMQPEQVVETLTTGTDGRFRASTSGVSTRRLRVLYSGSSLSLPIQRTLEMRVPAASSVRVSRRRLRNGQSVTFSGRVLGLPVPANGKLVEVQVRFTNRWQTFRTTRSDASGNWTSRYRFQRTRGIQRYRFRIRLPSEGGYPFETSVSRTLDVVVRGR